MMVSEVLKIAFCPAFNKDKLEATLSDAFSYFASGLSYCSASNFSLLKYYSWHIPTLFFSISFVYYIYCYLHSLKVDKWIYSLWSSYIICRISILSEFGSPCGSRYSECSVCNNSTQGDHCIRGSKVISLITVCLSRFPFNILVTYQNTAHHTNFQSCW